MDRNEYLEYRAETLRSASEQIGKYGRAILVLSSGAIALSVTSLDSITRKEEVDGLCALVFAWSLFGTSLFLIVFSEYAGFRAAHFNFKQVDQVYGQDDYIWKTTRWNHCVEFCNITAGLAFSLGAVALMWFAYENIGS
ncbi:MAG: hypothetical protein A49_12700 [Methyloceanibacter sp.]|nr:MAG: hypothetical protein A49_12700 [Methyloceanibacter sp.]